MSTIPKACIKVLKDISEWVGSAPICTAFNAFGHATCPANTKELTYDKTGAGGEKMCLPTAGEKWKYVRSRSQITEKRTQVTRVFAAHNHHHTLGVHGQSHIGRHIRLS